MTLGISILNPHRSLQGPETGCLSVMGEHGHAHQRSGSTVTMLKSVGAKCGGA